MGQYYCPKQTMPNFHRQDKGRLFTSQRPYQTLLSVFDGHLPVL